VVFASSCRLHGSVACSRDNIQLLLTGQVDEFHRITGYTDGEVCILFFLRMLHSVDQFLCTEYVYVQVMCTLIEVSVQSVNQIVGTLSVIMSQRSRADGLGVGDSVQSLLIRQLRNRVQRCQKAVLLCAVGRVCTRCQRFACFSSIRQRTGSFTIYNVGCNGKDGSGRLRISVGMAFFQLAHESSQQPYCDLVCTVIIVSVSREVTLCLEINSHSVFIADHFYL